MAIEQTPVLDQPVSESPSAPGPGVLVEPATHEQIATLAYQFWQARGCPQGSPEEDWFRAEEELKPVETRS